MRAVDARMPRGEGWVHEMCWPGRRLLVRVEGGRSELLGTDERAPAALRELGATLGATQVLLDGVLTTVAGPDVLMLFDVLHHDGRSLLDTPYEERRALLLSLSLDGARWQTPPDFGGDGAAAVRAAKELNLPGTVAKRTGSPYRPGEQSRDWRRVPVAR
jgi:bifunctional non-homologous end joining protein LigD